jgi:hypothetical protein
MESSQEDNILTNLKGRDVLYDNMSQGQMRKWLENYEKTRHTREPWTKEMWISDKYDFQSMDWRDLQILYLPEVRMRFGPACHKLKKLWKDYKSARKLGLSGSSQTAWEINQIQKSMGIQVSEFEELAAIGEYEDQDQEEIPGSDAEWSIEDLYEEQTEGDDWYTL